MKPFFPSGDEEKFFPSSEEDKKKLELRRAPPKGSEKNPVKILVLGSDTASFQRLKESFDLKKEDKNIYEWDQSFFEIILTHGIEDSYSSMLDNIVSPVDIIILAPKDEHQEKILSNYFQLENRNKPSFYITAPNSYMQPDMIKGSSIESVSLSLESTENRINIFSACKYLLPNLNEKQITPTTRLGN